MYPTSSKVDKLLIFFLKKKDLKIFFLSFNGLLVRLAARF